MPSTVYAAKKQRTFIMDDPIDTLYRAFTDNVIFQSVNQVHPEASQVQVFLERAVIDTLKKAIDIIYTNFMQSKIGDDENTPPATQEALKLSQEALSPYDVDTLPLDDDLTQMLPDTTEKYTTMLKALFVAMAQALYLNGDIIVAYDDADQCWHLDVTTDRLDQAMWTYYLQHYYTFYGAAELAELLELHEFKRFLQQARQQPETLLEKVSLVLNPTTLTHADLNQFEDAVLIEVLTSPAREQLIISDTALIWACTGRRFNLLSALLDIRQSVDLSGNQLPILFEMIDHNDIQALNLLSTKPYIPADYFEAPIKKPDAFAGFTPLHYAIYKGATDAALWLIEHTQSIGVRIEPGKFIPPKNHLDELNGNTALHLAVKHDQPTVVQALIERSQMLGDAILNRPNFLGQTPAVFVKEMEQPEIRRILFRNDAAIFSVQKEHTIRAYYYLYHPELFHGKTSTLSVLLELEYTRRKYPGFECQYFHFMDDFTQALMLWNKTRLHMNGVQHILCIIHPRGPQTGHTALLYGALTPNGPNQFLLFDVLGHDSPVENYVTRKTNLELTEHLTRHIPGAIVYTNTHKLQHTPQGCTVFNLYFAKQLYKHVIKGSYNLFGHLEKHKRNADPDQSALTLLDQHGLPPFGATAMYQGWTLIMDDHNPEAYVSKVWDARKFEINEKGETLEAYLERHSSTYTDNAGETRQRNGVFNHTCRLFAKHIGPAASARDFEQRLSVIGQHAAGLDLFEKALAFQPVLFQLGTCTLEIADNLATLLFDQCEMISVPFIEHLLKAFFKETEPSVSLTEAPPLRLRGPLDKLYEFVIFALDTMHAEPFQYVQTAAPLKYPTLSHAVLFNDARNALTPHMEASISLNFESESLSF